MKMFSNKEFKDAEFIRSSTKDLIDLKIKVIGENCSKSIQN